MLVISSSRFISTSPFSLSNHLFRKTHSLSSSTDFPANYQSSLQIPPFSQIPAKFSQLLNQRPPLNQLKQIHTQILTLSLSLNPSLITSLIHCYLSNHHLCYATILFENYPFYPPPTLIWNLMIRAHSKIQTCLEPINYLNQMLNISRYSTVLPDDYTFTSVISHCSRYNLWVNGELVHGLIIKTGFDSDLFVGNSLISMYSVFSKLENAHQVFDEMSVRDVFSWTSLLGGYAKHGYIDKARDVFGRMPVCNDVSWAVMISGFVANERYIEALDCFHGMLRGNKVKPNEAILVCVLTACARLGAFDQGNWVHIYIERINIPKTPNVCTALIDMFAKCGRIDCATRVFDGCSKRDLHNFTSMISGLSIHGLGKDAMRVFVQMLDEGFKPNEVTILGVLNGCSHSGLVEEGTSIFNDMEKLWGIVPKIEHYGCYVDLLSRAGLLERAFQVVKTMPMEPDAAIWRALLSACRTYRNISLGEQIINHVQQLGSSSQVMISSLYAYMDKWESVVQMREKMVEKRNRSELGCSWIEANGITHEFRVDDQIHPRISAIREKLDEILDKAKLGGYITNTTQVTFDLSEEDKELAVSLHSEKLALAFGLMNTKPGTLIRIVKNLRTCQDCHSALKAISRVFNRDIVVRDRSRFHTFKLGSCSCNDYW